MNHSVLIADDEPIIRLDIAEMLEEAGYSVVCQASDGFDALRGCREHAPDLVLLDIKMPLLDGLTAARMIREEGLECAIVLLTAFSSDEFVSKASELLVEGYIVKPVDQKTLIPAVAVAIAKYQQLKGLEATVLKKERDLEDRKIIERAKGILMEQKGMSEKEAYQLLRSFSMSKRCSLSQIARAVVTSYE